MVCIGSLDAKFPGKGGLKGEGAEAGRGGGWGCREKGTSTACQFGQGPVLAEVAAVRPTVPMLLSQTVAFPYVNLCFETGCHVVSARMKPRFHVQFSHGYLGSVLVLRETRPDSQVQQDN